MAHIEEIRFDHVSKAEGCMCDNCGAWLTNIWTVKFREGESLHFGIDCFDKRIRGKLNAFGKKEMQKVQKRIQWHSEELNHLMQEEVPEDVSVTGFDNYLSKNVTSTEITTVYIKPEDTASIAADLIIKKINGEPYAKGRHLVGGTTIHRQSVRQI